jgi:hypothetical protein
MCLHLDGKDLRAMPLKARNAKLGRLVQCHDCPRILLSANFADDARLLAACEERGLEGIVSKRSTLPTGRGPAPNTIPLRERPFGVFTQPGSDSVTFDKPRHLPRASADPHIPDEGRASMDRRRAPMNAYRGWFLAIAGVNF